MWAPVWAKLVMGDSEPNKYPRATLIVTQVQVQVTYCCIMLYMKLSPYRCFTKRDLLYVHNSRKVQKVPNHL